MSDMSGALRHTQWQGVTGSDQRGSPRPPRNKQPAKGEGRERGGDGRRGRKGRRVGEGSNCRVVDRLFVERRGRKLWKWGERERGGREKLITYRATALSVHCCVITARNANSPSTSEQTPPH